MNTGKGPKKSYPHRLLSRTLVELNMGAHIFARLCGIDAREMREVLMLKKIPRRNNPEKDVAIRIKFQTYSGILWEKLFPNDPRLKVQIDRDLPQSPLDRLMAREAESSKYSEVLDEVLNSLHEREQVILRTRFFDAKTYDECADKFRVTRERIRQIEAKALRRLRHPTRIRQLTEAYR